MIETDNYTWTEVLYFLAVGVALIAWGLYMLRDWWLPANRTPSIRDRLRGPQ